MEQRNSRGRSAQLATSVATLLLAAFVATGCGSDGLSDKAICSVGDVEVTKVRFDQALDAARSQTKARTGTSPAGAEATALRGQVVAQLLQAAAWRSLAADRDVTVSDKQVDAAIDELVKTGFGGDEKRFRSQLEVEGRSVKQVRADLRDQLYVERVTEDARSGLKLDRDELQDWLEAHPRDFGGTPDTREVQHVLIRVGGKAGAEDDAAATAFAERTRRELGDASPAEFATIAKRFSDDPTYGPLGGTLTYERGTIDPAFEKAAFELEVDALSPVVKTVLGWHVIVPRSEIERGTVPDLDKVEDEVRDAARAEAEVTTASELQEDITKLVADADCRKAYRVKPAATPSPSKQAPPSKPAPSAAPPSGAATPSEQPDDVDENDQGAK